MFDLARFIGSEGGEQRSGGLDLGCIDPGLGLERANGGRDAAAQPSAAEGHDDRVNLRQVFNDLQADRSIAGDNRRITDGMNHSTGQSLEAMRHNDLPPFIKWNFHDPRAVALDRVELDFRRMIGDDHAARNAHAMSNVRKSLGHVPGAGGVNAVGEHFRLGGSHRVSRATHLE